MADTICSPSFLQFQDYRETDELEVVAVCQCKEVDIYTDS